MAGCSDEGPEIARAMASLPQKQRIVLELHYIEGYKIYEIARMLGVPDGTVKWRLAQGRKMLKRLLGEGA